MLKAGKLMLRLIRIGDQIMDGADDFAFWDTVTDRFVSFADWIGPVLSSLDELDEALRETDLPEGWPGRIRSLAIAADPPLRKTVAP